MQKAIPTVDLLLFVIVVLDGGNVDGCLVREQDTVGFLQVSQIHGEEGAAHKVLVTGQQNSVQHGFVQQKVSHPLISSIITLSLFLKTHLGDDDVERVDWQLNILQLALDEFDLYADQLPPLR